MTPRVLIIIDTGIIGGPGRGLFQFIRHAGIDNFHYVLCSFKYRRAKSTEFIDYARSIKANLRLLKQRFRFDPSPVWQTMRLIREESCNIIQTHGYKGHVIALMLTKLLNLHWVAVTHGWTDEDWKIRLYNRLDAWLLKHADVVVAVSPPLLQTMSKLRGPAKDSRLILNAVDDEQISGGKGGATVRSHCHVGRDELLIGTFGRLSPEKGHRNLLHAFQMVRAEHQEVSLVIVGDGPERPTLEMLVQQLGMAGKVHFHGYQPAMRDYYEAIDLLVLPSLSEGLPNVMLEAMLLRKPVLATDVGAVKEVIEDGVNGWIIPVGDATALAAKLSQIIGRRGLLKDTGTRAHNSLYPKFSPKLRAEKIMRLYNDILNAD